MIIIVLVIIIIVIVIVIIVIVIVIISLIKVWGSGCLGGLAVALGVRLPLQRATGGL